MIECEPYSLLPKRVVLSERSDRVLVLIVDVEEWQQTAHGESLDDNARKTGQLDVSTGALAGLEKFDEQADSAGIEAIDARKIEDELILTVLGEFGGEIRQAGRERDLPAG